MTATTLTGAQERDATIDTADLKDGAVTLAKQANLAAGNVIGQTAGGTGAPGAIPVDGVTLEVLSKLQVKDGGITLAKQANLAQDQFIGRVTASTGVPETATITAAARTVLDDTTVGAMVDTLGGASATGSGGLVRATSPTIVTPAVDQIVSTRPTWSESGGIARDLAWYQRRSLRSWLKNPAQTSYLSYGMIAAPTVTSNSAAASGDSVTRPLLTIDTTTTTGNFCEVITATFNYVRRCWSPTLIVPVRTAVTITNVRHWIGFGNQSLNANASPTGQHIAAFYYDTGVHGTAFWRTYTCDGAAATSTTTSVAYASSTEAMYRVDIDGSVVNFYIDDVRVASHSTNLPGNTTNMGFFSTLTNLLSTSAQQKVGTFQLLHT